MISFAKQWPFIRLSRSIGGGTAYSSSVSVIASGPTFTDAFSSVRAPTANQLIELYRALFFNLSNINAKGVWRVPLRLYAASGNGRPTPRSACRPRKLNSREFRRLAHRDLPWTTRAMAAAEEVHEVTEHPLLDLLDNPDPDGYFDRSQLEGLIVRYCDITGIAYCEIPDGVGPIPSAILPLQSQFVYPVRSLNYAKIEGYRYFNRFIKPENMLRFRLYPSLKDPWGSALSPAEASVQYAGLEDRWVSIQSQILGNGPRPELLVTAKDSLGGFGPDERERLEKEMNIKHSRGRIGRVLVADGALDVKPLSFPPNNLSGLDVANYVLERTANAFDVPLPLLSKETNLANMQAAERAHARHGVEPRCHMIASVLTRLARTMDPRLFFAYDPACDEDDESEARVFDMGLKNGSQVINEVRHEQGFDPVPWGDEPWLSNTLAQPSAMEEMRAQAASAAGLASGEDAPPEPEGDDDEDEPKPEPKKPQAKQSRALYRRFNRVLKKIEASLDDRPSHSSWAADSVGLGNPATSTRAGGEQPGRRRGLTPGGGSPGPSRDESLSPSGGDANTPETEKILPGSGDSDPGDAAGEGSPSTGSLPAAG